MAADGFDEEYDPDFLDQLDQLEAQILSSANSTQLPRPLPPHLDISHSPPRELSQRVKDVDEVFDRIPGGFGFGSRQPLVAQVPQSRFPCNAKEEEINRLKRELGSVSKQLRILEQECSELRRDRDKREDHLKSISLCVKTKNAEICATGKNLDSGGKFQDSRYLGYPNLNSSDDQILNSTYSGVSTCKDVGVQTEKIDESTQSVQGDGLSSVLHCSSKLFNVWNAGNDQKEGVDLVSKLLMSCEKDFAVLFGCLNFTLPQKTATGSDTSSCDAALQDYLQPAHSIEAVKVFHLYSILTKMSNGMVKREVLLGALVDLCHLQNAVVVYRALSILHMVLNHLPSIERKLERRDNIMIEELSGQKDAAEVYQSECSGLGSFLGVNNDESARLHTLFKRRSTDVQPFNWLLVFEVMNEIVTRKSEEFVILEAISIMSLIILRTNAYTEREKFGSVTVFQSVSQLLRKDAGAKLQKKAVHLLYLLLNCPKLMTMFCSGFKDEEHVIQNANSNAKNMLSSQAVSMILEGLAQCICCSGNNAQGLKLRRNAITVLAFIASSGDFGFEILWVHRLQRGIGFLSLIMQIMLSEIDAETSDNPQPPQIFKERTLLIREALILLNRSVSNPKYSATVLRVLTSSRDVACVTIAIANRLSRKGKWLRQTDSMTRQIRESEIVDLALVFKKRVFPFLGDGFL